jgi:hypothetical protein
VFIERGIKLFTIAGSYKKDDNSIVCATCSYALNNLFKKGFEKYYDTKKEFWYSQLNGRVTLNNYQNIANGFEQSLQYIIDSDERAKNSLFEKDILELINNIRNRNIRYLIMG